jgi:hypothetical protein
VWDDVRSILLVIVLLFPVLALTLDDTLLNHLGLARWLAVGGFLFAVAVSEGLLVGLRMRLPLPFRIPYYGMLALLFLYPLVLLPSATGSHPQVIAWRIFYFNPLAALVLLSLVPAVRRGQSLVENNGTPWSWPRYPWALFITLGICVCFRAYSLSLSFDPVLSLGTAAAMDMQSAFGAYFFVPIAFAAAVLLLEHAIVTRQRATSHLALALPLLCLAISIPHFGGNAAYATFIAQFVGRYGSPIFLTAVMACLFFAYALIRKVRLAEPGLAIALLVLTAVGRGTIGLATITEPQVLPVAVLGMLELAWAIRTRDSRRFTVAALSAAATLHWTLSPPWWMTAHVALGAVLLIAIFCRDAFVRYLRIAAATLLATGCIGAFVFRPDVLGHALPLYVTALVVLSMGLAIWLRSKAFASAAFAGIGVVCIDGAGRLVAMLRDWPGIESFLLACVLLAVAVGISLSKTDTARRYFAEFRKPQRKVTNDSG